MTEADIREALRKVIDPELGVNIVDLGLVYRIELDEAHVCITMTMTSPACPLGRYLQDLVESNIKWHVPAAQDVAIDLVWDPAWTPEMMSDDARRQLGWEDLPGRAPTPGERS